MLDYTLVHWIIHDTVRASACGCGSGYREQTVQDLHQMAKGLFSIRADFVPYLNIGRSALETICDSDFCVHDSQDSNCCLDYHEHKFYDGG